MTPLLARRGSHRQSRTPLPDDRRAHAIRARARWAVGLGAVVLLASARADAQQPAPAPSSSARIMTAGVLKRGLYGAISGSVLATGFYFLSERGERSNGCQPLNCALPFLTLTGGVAGLFIGRELELQQRAFAPRVGRALRMTAAAVELPASATALAVHDSLIAVASDSGVQLLVASPAPRALRRRANGLNAVQQVALLPARQTLLVGTGTALFETPLTTGPATRIQDGVVDALGASDDATLRASGTRLWWRQTSGDVVRMDSLQMPHAVRAIAWDATRRVWWVATDSALFRVAIERGTLMRDAAARPLPAAPRALAIHPRFVAVAMGDAGIVAYRTEAEGDAPLRLEGEPRFAYDLAFLGDGLFVAAGVDGVVQVALGPSAAVLGASRQVAFATSIRAHDGALWVGDRTHAVLTRLVP